MGELSTAEIEERVEKFSAWYHNIDLLGVQTNPSNPDYPASRWRLIEPHVPRDLTGKTVLDLGCNAGYFALQMRRRGARVVGVDWFPEAIEQARFVAEVLELEIDYRLENIYRFALQSTQRFDYVLFLGVFYHLRYPLLILDRLAEMVVEKLYFQTVITERPGTETLSPPDDISTTDVELLTDPRFPRLAFIENRLNGAWNNWFVCNSSGVEAMLRSSGFTDLVHAGEDCYVCGPAQLEVARQVAHDLSAIRE
jgi:tRNA (mo5U34)-methyltransferase